jgi:hypothetical protein
VANSNKRLDQSQVLLIKTFPSATIAFICSCIAVMIMAFLIPFGILQSCSFANAAIFIILLGVSAFLILFGIVLGASSLRKTKSRFASTSLLFTFLYVALLVYLIQLMY